MAGHKNEKKAYLLNGCRTPIGSFKRTLRNVPPEKLAEHVIAALIRRANLSNQQIDGVILGHGYQSSYAPNTARCAALAAGLPASVPAMTVQRQCGSGMEAVNLSMKEIFLGNGDIYLAGGTESMSGVPYLLPANLRYKGPLAKYFPFGPRPVVAGLADDGLVPKQLLWDPKTTYMAGTAQRLADTYAVSRSEADEYAFRSQTLAAAAIKNGLFDIEIEAIDVKNRGLFRKDEHPRETSLEKLSSLKSVLKTRDITAGNSSGINDGACVLAICSKARLAELEAIPLAALVDSVVTGGDPEQMGLGPVMAIRALLERQSLKLDDIDLFEINEAFAAQYVACEKLLGLDRAKVNVNGGAIALGHPIGMSGARLILTLAHELRRRGLRRGIASLCIGGGMGIATLVEVEN
ncbi:MAG: thiolase family protein [Candidatus Obscuribacterales bacterium]|nr:thiolase family protein [Candidatus Obscuribacterales bacterium]